ncbi:acyltransferase family protein [Paenibacillus etheri]|uniref:acyltransferase family protein n=1 Tax=Paenibacillus etheri TaxID=1306852 RepID=UPI003CC90D03
MPGIDGLRALSVLAVIAYHLNLNWAEGGLLGVGIFFVISGYLITDQIISQWERHRRLNLLDFWVRRLRRLLPAMVVMLFVVAIWLLIIEPSRLFGLKGDFISSLFYFNNWWLIFHNVSYFESFGPPSPIGHLWSLSIEGQFYILWPIVLIIVMKIARRRGKLIAWIMACAAVSALAMALIYVPGTDPSRVYYGTDTRVFALLIGAALAVAWPSQKLNDKVSEPARRVLDIVGGLGLILLLVLFYQVNEFDDLLYRGGFLVISLIAAVVIAVLAHPASRLGAIVGCKPLRWIGVRSYSLYIWHFPVIILSSPNVNTEESSILRIIIQVAVSFLLAALSYKYVEEPIRRGSFNETWKNISVKRRGGLRPGFLMAIIAVILIPIACKGYLLNAGSDTPAIELADMQYEQQQLQQQEQQLQQQEQQDLGIKDDPATTEPEAKKPDPKVGAINTEVVKPETEVEKSVPEEKTSVVEKNQSGEGVTAIGDSVILDVAPYLSEELPGIVIEGKIGRQMAKAQEVVDQLKAQGRLGKKVIIELGTNGSFSSKQLRDLLDSLSDVEQILLVNTRVPRKWENNVNHNISKVSSEYSNTTVVDWYSASEGRDDYFYQDGVHLKPEGSKYYASLLAKALESL